jgi:hypothetical protein
MRSLSARQRLEYLRGNTPRALKDARRFLALVPESPCRGEHFALRLDLPRAAARELDLARFEVIFPSGKTSRFDYRPAAAARKRGVLAIEGFKSAEAGELYASARLYFRDGSVRSDACLTSVFSTNPDTLAVTPRTLLVSGRAGRVEYDWDDDEFHCRAYATITNGSNARRTFTSCKVRVTDGGENGTLISAFAFNVGPFTVSPGEIAYRTVDTWYPKGSAVWDKFNKRWDLTVKFTYAAGNVEISDGATYRPMTTLPLNVIWCDDYSAEQWKDLRDAVDMAAEILEDRDVTLYNPDWRILSREADKDRYGIIDLEWEDGKRDYEEANELRENVSGPDGERVDLFVPLGFAYSDDTPADKRNVNGFSPEPGPFPKDDDAGRSGLIVKHRSTSTLKLGETIAHELGHYLGLPHVSDESNLMFDSSGRTDNKLTWDQWNTITQHGMAKWLAPDI